MTEDGRDDRAQRRGVLLELLAELEALADAPRDAGERRASIAALAAPLGDVQLSAAHGTASITARRADVDDAADAWAAWVGAATDALGPPRVGRDDTATWDVGDRVAAIGVDGTSVVVTVRAS